MLQSVTRKQAVSFIDLNDVLAYIRSASQTEKRCIQIAMNSQSSNLVVKPGNTIPGTSGKKKDHHFKENAVELFKLIFQKYFYLRSFRVTSLSEENMKKVVELCDKAKYDVMEIQFKRVSFDYFEMLNKGEKTYYGYFIETKEID